MCNYPHQTNIRKFAAWQQRGPKFQSRGHKEAFLDQLSKQGFNPQIRYETLEINVVFINSCSVLSCHSDRAVPAAVA